MMLFNTAGRPLKGGRKITFKNINAEAEQAEAAQYAHLWEQRKLALAVA